MKVDKNQKYRFKWRSTDLNEGMFSIITQVIIEILVISLVEDYVISCYNHLTRGDYSRSTNFQTAAWRFVDVSDEEISTMKENAIPKGFKDVAKSQVKLFEGRIWKIC